MDLEGLTREWQRFFNLNATTASPGVVWETFKLHTRAVLSPRISHLKSSSKQTLKGATAQLHLLEESFTTSPSPALAINLKMQTPTVDQLHLEQAKHQLFFFI